MTYSKDCFFSLRYETLDARCSFELVICIPKLMFIEPQESTLMLSVFVVHTFPFPIFESPKKHIDTFSTTDNVYWLLDHYWKIHFINALTLARVPLDQQTLSSNHCSPIRDTFFIEKSKLKCCLYLCI